MSEIGESRGARETKLDKEARRLLPLLARPGAFACVQKARRYGEQPRVAICLPGGGSRRPRIDYDFLKAMLSRDLLRQSGPERWTISET